MIGNVEQVITKDVNTRYGQKKTFSIKVDGDWYAHGFKDPKVSVGDTVDFEFKSGQYGNEIVAGSLKAAAKSNPVAPAIKAVPMSSGGGSKGVFPIPPLDGQRAIVRQNALTNAREMYCHAVKDIISVDDAVASIIDIARKFEAYSCGDLDLEDAKAHVAAQEAA